MYQFNEFVNQFSQYNKSLIEAITTAYSVLVEATMQEIHDQYYKEIPAEIFQNLSKIDPTGSIDRKGKYLDWIIRKAYKNNPRIVEDAEKVYNDLKFFDKYQSKLNTQIGQIPDQYELSKLVIANQDKTEQMKGTKEKVKEIKTQGADKIYDANGWVIIAPKTEEAACYYGKGTRWCTAADKNNMFDHYNKEGQLYIVINKADPEEKYQLHFERKSFMDANDNPIERDEWSKLPDDVISKIIEIADKHNGMLNFIFNLPSKWLGLSIDKITPEKLRRNGKFSDIKIDKNNHVLLKIIECPDIERLWDVMGTLSTDMDYTVIDEPMEFYDSEHVNDENFSNATSRELARSLVKNDIEYDTFITKLSDDGKDDLVSEIEIIYNDSYVHGSENARYKSFKDALTTKNDNGIFVVFPEESQSKEYEIWIDAHYNEVYTYVNLDEDHDWQVSDFFTMGFKSDDGDWTGFDKKYFNDEVYKLLITEGYIKQ